MFFLYNDEDMIVCKSACIIFMCVTKIINTRTRYYMININHLSIF